MSGRNAESSATRLRTPDTVVSLSAALRGPLQVPNETSAECTCRPPADDTFATALAFEQHQPVLPSLSEEQLELRAATVRLLLCQANENELQHTESAHIAVRCVDTLITEGAGELVLSEMRAAGARGREQEIHVLASTCLILADKMSNDLSQLRHGRHSCSPCLQDELMASISLLTAELAVLWRVRFTLHLPTPILLIDSLSETVPASCTKHKSAAGVAQKLCTLAVTEYALVRAFPRSLCAASALYLARRLVGITDAHSTWTPALEQASGYFAGELSACVAKLKELHERVSHDAYLYELYWQ